MSLSPSSHKRQDIQDQNRKLTQELWFSFGRSSITASRKEEEGAVRREREREKVARGIARIESKPRLVVVWRRGAVIDGGVVKGGRTVAKRKREQGEKRG